jgi:hypothetical protein
MLLNCPFSAATICCCCWLSTEQVLLLRPQSWVDRHHGQVELRLPFLGQPVPRMRFQLRLLGPQPRAVQDNRRLDVSRREPSGHVVLYERRLSGRVLEAWEYELLLQPVVPAAR